MTPIAIPLINFLQFQVGDIPPSLSSTYPFYLNHNDNIVFVYPIISTVGSTNTNMIGIFIVIINQAGSFCTYSSIPFPALHIGISGIITGCSCFIKGDYIYLANSTGFFTKIIIPTYFVSKGKINILSVIYKAAPNCPYPATPFISQGPFILDFQSIKPKVCFISNYVHVTPPIDPGSYSGLIYDYDGNKYCDIWFNYNFPIPLAYGLNVIQSNGVETIMKPDSLGHNTLLETYTLTGSYDLNTYCYIPGPPYAYGNFSLSYYENLVISIPDITEGYKYGCSNNSFFSIFCGSQDSRFYLSSIFFNVSLLFSQNFGTASKVLFLNNKAFFIFNNNPLNIAVSSDLSPYVKIPNSTNIPTNNSNNANLGFGNSIPIQKQLLNTNKYLINFNRPVSAIGAYKT